VRAADASVGDRVGPLTDGEVDALFAPLAGAGKIALAVSGGADSLALLLAADRWRRRGADRPAVVVLTVNHGLRTESRGEAEAVVAIAAASGLGARLLTWAGPRPTADIEAAARLARYGLLLAACREIGASHLAVAHHQNDVAETFLLRFRRRAGVFGLAAMRPAIDLGGVTLVRPFLDVPRARLAATTAAAGLTPADDPMNRDPRFERAQVRALIPTMAAAGVTAAALAEAAREFRAAADAIDEATSEIIAEGATADALGVAWLTPRALAKAGEAVRVRVLARVMLAVGGDDYAPGYRQLAALVQGLGDRRLKRTLGGVVIQTRAGRVCFYREVGRQGLTTVPAAAGVVWDRRFATRIGATAAQGLTIGPLGEMARRELGLTGGEHPPGAIAASPAFRLGDEIIAGPAVSQSIGLPAAVALATQRLAHPPLFPAFTTAA